jgi:hypothetical protein
MSFDFSRVPQELLDLLSDRQRVYVTDAAEGLTWRQISEKHGRAERVIANSLKNARAKFAAAGYTETFNATRFVDPGQRITGKSTYTKDDEGNPVWVKTREDFVPVKLLIEEFIDGMKDTIPRAKPVKVTKQGHENLMSQIFIGDAHIGMRAWSKETKSADFDTSEATAQLRDAIGYLIDKADPCEYGVLVDVGDFTHSDSSKDQTYKGTPVDVDTRHSKVMYEAARVMCWAIDQMLRKFQKVIVVVVPGNHNSFQMQAAP